MTFQIEFSITGEEGTWEGEGCFPSEDEAEFAFDYFLRPRLDERFGEGEYCIRIGIRDL